MYVLSVLIILVNIGEICYVTVFCSIIPDVLISVSNNKILFKLTNSTIN